MLLRGSNDPLTFQHVKELYQPRQLSRLMMAGPRQRASSLKIPRGNPVDNELPVASHMSSCSRKEVFQPHLPVRLPCYDFTPLTLHTFGASPLDGWAGDFGCRRLGWCDGRCVQGPGTYSPRRADPRLLATPASRRRVAASDPNWGRLCGIRSPSRGRNPLYRPL